MTIHKYSRKVRYVFNKVNIQGKKNVYSLRKKKKQGNFALK